MRSASVTEAKNGLSALLALVNFWWLYPVLTAEIVPYAEWSSRMLFKKGWI